MANVALSSQVPGCCLVDLKIKEASYNKVKFLIMASFWCSVILEHDFLRHHSNVEISFGGQKRPLKLCEPITALFANLISGCKPIDIKSRRHTNDENHFIHTEIKKMLREVIIEPSYSTWRAKVLVTSSENHIKRIVIAYSQTIYKFTRLNEYPLPRIDNMIREIAKYGVYRYSKCLPLDRNKTK